MKLVLSVVLCLSLAVTLCSAGRRSSFTITPSSVSCTPRRMATCGEAQLIGRTSTPLTDAEGVNVCNETRMYTVQTFLYVETRYCFGTRCSTYCRRTSNCTGPMRNITRSKNACCDGFAVDPDDKQEDSFFFYRRKNSLSCPITLSDSVAVCLLDVQLNLFAGRLFEDAADVIPLLANSDTEDRYTVFAVNSSDLNDPDLPLNSRGHIVNGTVDKKHFSHHSATLYPTLRENVTLHVVRGVKSKTFFVNGVEIEELKACQARNGVVHVVNSIIPQSTMTIAQMLKDDARFSTFLQLLDGANITMFLDTGRKSRTLLAPTNDAFDNLPTNAAECLLRPENSRYLSQLVLIHISSPAEYSSTLSQLSRLYTFNTRYYLFVNTDMEDIFVTNDRIPLEEADITASNGVIHAIPDVIVPPEVDFDKICDNGPNAVIGD